MALFTKWLKNIKLCRILLHFPPNVSPVGGRGALPEPLVGKCQQSLVAMLLLVAHMLAHRTSDTLYHIPGR